MSEETDALPADDTTPADAADDTTPAEDTPPADAGETNDAASSKDVGEVKDTKTLLSDDEGDGAGDKLAPDAYEFVSPDDIGPIEMTDAVKAQFDAFGERAKDADLTQAQYQKLVEGEIRRGRTAMNEMAEGYQQRIEGWADTTRADKELGGEDLAENLSTAKLGMDTFGTPALKQLFDKPSRRTPKVWALVIILRSYACSIALGCR
jgi:hypothetical protein